MVWAVLGETTLTSSADVITVDSIAVKKHLVVQAKLLRSGNIEAAIRFNNDSGNNYSTKYSVNDSESSGTNKSSIDTNLTAAGNEFATYNIFNEATKEKLVISELVDSNTSGAGNAPQRVEVVGKWTNTSNAITRVDLINVGGGDFAAGSEVVVWGDDGTDAGQTGIPTGSIHEESDTGKHKIWNATTSTWTEIA